jgi:hypothetical protein
MMTTPKDDKYIVFKREQWERFWFRATPEDIMPTELEDAVVIRRQDAFAPPALEAYANAITITLQLHRDDTVTGPHVKRLQEIADYFHSQAAAAWDTHRKIPD